jgi:hypothetical protein
MEELRIFLQDRGAQVYLFVVFLAVRGCLIRYYNCSDNRKGSSSSTSKSARPSFLPLLLSLAIVCITWFYIFRFIFTNVHTSESYFDDAYRDVLKDEGHYGVSTQLLTWAIIAIIWMEAEGTASDLYFLGFGFLGAMSASFVLWVPSLYRRGNRNLCGRKSISIFSALCAAAAFVCILNLHPCSKDEQEGCDEDTGFGSFQPSFHFWLHSLHYVLILPVLVLLLPFRLPCIDAALVYGVLAVTLSLRHISLILSSGNSGIAHVLAEPMTDCQLSITTDLVFCSFITIYAVYHENLLDASAGWLDSKTDSTKQWSKVLFRTSLAMLSLPLVSPAAVLAFHLCLRCAGASHMALVSWLQQWMADRIRGERPCRLEGDAASSDRRNGNGHNGNGHSGGVSHKTRQTPDQRPRWCNLGLWNDGDSGNCDPLEEYDEACERLALALGSAAGLTTTDTVLCCGCGLGAELGLYKDFFKLRHITGIDPHFDLAAERKRSCSNRHDFNIRRMRARVEDLHQSGPESLFPPTYFSKILALDNVYHYTSKLNFFRDCAHMLAPGGKVGVTDVFLVNGETPLWVRLALRILGISDCNLWTQNEYINYMSNIGFVDIKIESIGSRVFFGWKHFLPEALTKHLEYAIIIGTRPPIPAAKETKQKKVAIIGSGLSGLMAAYTIVNSSRGANVAVTIFEANDRPGLAGYSDTYEGELIDVPPRMAAEGYYKQYRELLSSLEIPTAVVRTDCTYYGEDGSDGTSVVHAYYDKSGLVNLYFAVCVGGLSNLWRMIGAMSNTDKDILGTDSMPLFGDWLSRYFDGYSSSSAPSKSHGNTSFKFNDNPFLSLFVGSLGWMLSCTYIQLMQYPADIILPYIHGLYESNCSSLLVLLFGGGQVVRVIPSIKALEQALLYGVELKCGGRVTGVDERKIVDGVSYDAVIIATEACAVPKVLKNGPKVFGKIKYHPSTIYLHTDESFMPPNKKEWRCWNVELKPASDEPQLTFWLNEFYPDSNFSTNVFQTWAPLRNPKPELIVKKCAFQRVVHTSATRGMISEIESEQGKGRIYYAGSYCVYGMGLLEQALISGRKTAENLLEDLFEK